MVRVSGGCAGGGDVTRIEPRAGNVQVFRGGVGAEEFAKVGVREVRVRVPSGLVFGGGATPRRGSIELRVGNFHGFRGGVKVEEFLARGSIGVMPPPSTNPLGTLNHCHSNPNSRNFSVATPPRNPLKFFLRATAEYKSARHSDL